MTSLFSSGLMKDTYKRIMPLSIIFGILTAIVSAAAVFFNSFLYEDLFGMLGGAPLKLTYDFFEYSPLIITFASLGVPVFVITANSYMTRRADSDFYDALPHTRTSFAASSMLAIFITSLVITLVGFGTSLGCAYLFSDTLSVPWVSSLLKLLAIILVVWLALAAFSLSSAITGTTFNALAIGYLILDGPRAVMSLINSAIAEFSPVIVADSAIPLFDNNYNLYTALGAANYKPLTSPAAYIYTAALAILYTALSVIAFNKRKSESATHAAPSRLAQHIYRIAVSSLVSVLGIFLLFSWGFDTLSVTVFIIALAVYFIYELITTKRAKNLLGALATLPLFVLFNALIAGIIVVGGYAETSYAPEADEVDSVSIVLEGESLYVDFDEYVTLMSEKIPLTDMESRLIITDALKKNIEEHEKGTYFGTFVSGYNDYHYATVKIKSGLRTEYRGIYIPTAEYMTILDKLSENESYRELWYKLPESPEIVSAEFGSISFDDVDSRLLYSALRDEILELGYDGFVELYNTSDYSEAELYIHFNVDIGGSAVTVALTVPTEMTELYSLAEEKKLSIMQEKKSDILSLLDEFLADDTESLYLEADVYTPDDVYFVFGYRSEFDSVERGGAEELVTLLRAAVTDEYASYQDPSYIIITVTDYEGERGSTYIMCKISSAVTIENIKEIFTKYGY